MFTASRGWVPLALVLTLILPGAFADTGGLRAQVDRLRDAPAPAIAEVPLYSGRLLAEFYAERAHRDAWDARRAEALLELAEASPADGLDPSDFHADAIRALLAAGDLDDADEAVRTRADILLSDALLRYLHHLQYGKYNPRHVTGWTFVEEAGAADLKSEMQAVLAAPDLAAAVADRLPEAPFYANLKLGYQRYLANADAGDWKAIPQGPNLKLGMRDARVPSIRERLAVSEGIRLDGGDEPERYGEALANAVKDFQGRSGLAEDGIVGPNTLRALNVPLDERLAKIRANLERMRWLYHELPPDHVFVDVAGFRLEVVRDRTPVWQTRTVVGTVEDQTPTFRDEMEHLVFNPTWSVPKSIQRTMGSVSDKYHVIERRTGRRVSQSDVSDTSRYRVLQPAGPQNALGRVKFMFPNGHAIYLHDTPSRYLFQRGTRTYSHGCVRVKEPLTLARLILDRPGWDDAEINRLVNRGRTRYVNLDDHLPVLIYYLTAVADDDGRVGFRRDIYDRDRSLLAVIGGPAHSARIAFREPEPDDAQVPQTAEAQGDAPPAAAAQTARESAAGAAAEPSVAATPTPAGTTAGAPAQDAIAEPAAAADQAPEPEPAALAAEGTASDDRADASAPASQPELAQDQTSRDGEGNADPSAGPSAARGGEPPARTPPSRLFVDQELFGPS